MDLVGIILSETTQKKANRIGPHLHMESKKGKKQNKNKKTNLRKREKIYGLPQVGAGED